MEANPALNYFSNWIDSGGDWFDVSGSSRTGYHRYSFRVNYPRHGIRLGEKITPKNTKSIRSRQKENSKMTFYFIGLGLSDEKDISIKGLEIIKRCDKIYLENYTSIMQCSIKDLEKLYGKKIISVDRKKVEELGEQIITEAKNKNVALLIVGDPFSATTHIDLFKTAKEKNILVKIIHNASVLTAIGITGLQLYKFGKITSLPFPEDNPTVETPYTILKDNLNLGLHTLLLLDLKPEKNKFMTIPEALEIIENIEKRKKDKIINKDTFVVGCTSLGSNEYVVKAGNVEAIKKINFGKPPYCLIIPGKLHFVEEEMLKLYSY